MRRSRLRGRLLLALLALITTPLLVELAIQLVGDPRYARIAEQIDEAPSYWKLAREGLLELDDRALRFRLKPGFRATVEGVDYRVNALGLRGPEIAPTKPAGTRRVLLLGDSYAFGLGVSEEASIETQLAALLQETMHATGGGAVEVINAGVPAYQTEQERLLLERTGFALEPDLVVLLYFANDKLPDPLTWAPAINILYHDELPVPYSWKPFLARSFLYAVAAKLVAARHAERGDYDSRGSQHWPITMARLDAIAEACRGRNVPLLLAAIPEMSSTKDLTDPSTEPFTDHAAVLDYAAARHLPCVDLRAGLLTKSRTFEKLFLSLLPVDTHFNAKGCRFAAELIAPAAAELLR